jgi:hypothetical protein
MIKRQCEEPILRGWNRDHTGATLAHMQLSPIVSSLWKVHSIVPVLHVFGLLAREVLNE